jgi:hypothetical protein
MDSPEWLHICALQGPSENLDDRRTRDIKIHVIDVSFDVLKDSAERDCLHRLPASLVLPGEAVDRLRAGRGRQSSNRPLSGSC